MRSIHGIWRSFMLLSEQLASLNMLKILKLALIHDLPEIYAQDPEDINK